MSITTITYSANTPITFDLSGLATSSTFTAGRECTEIDNTVNQYVDALVNVKGILGNAGTPPAIGQTINLRVWGSDVSLGTEAIDTLIGADGARTLTHVGVLNSIALVASPAVTEATTGLTYYIQPFSIAGIFGVMPKFWGLFASHNQAGALAAAQTGLFQYTGIKYTHT